MRQKKQKFIVATRVRRAVELREIEASGPWELEDRFPLTEPFRIVPVEGVPQGQVSHSIIEAERFDDGWLNEVKESLVPV